MHAHFQVFVYLDKFRNLDLFHQGEYAIRWENFRTQDIPTCTLWNFKTSKLLNVAAQGEGSFGAYACSRSTRCLLSTLINGVKEWTNIRCNSYSDHCSVRLSRWTQSNSFSLSSFDHSLEREFVALVHSSELRRVFPKFP